MTPSANLTPLAARAYQLAEALRKKSVAVSTEQVALMLESMGCFSALSLREVYWCGRATLCGSRDQFGAYDECFFETFGGTSGTEAIAVNAGIAAATVSRRAMEADPGAGSKAERIGTGGASAVEVLRHRDIAELTDDEQRELFHLMAKFDSPRRRSQRGMRAAAGAVDVARTVRCALSHGGDPLRIYRVAPKTHPRRQILLIDVSGSMARYAEVLLRLGHGIVRAAPRTVNVFTLGTQLTHITRALRDARDDIALADASSAIPDWQGGTRLGEQLQVFLDEWGRRGMARGADVVIASDGLERGDCKLLAQQMVRLKRLAYRVIWCNPHKSTPGYEPITSGMRAVLPYVDELVAGRTLAEIEEHVLFRF
jgi:uncharacterized protein with von Willebrand factor type A (vWA) domain